MPSSSDQAESRIQPVARFELAKAAPAAAAGPKDGATVFNTVCGACHNTGVAGAPKAGDKAAWAPRIAQGNATLYKTAIAGKGAMPPKGGASRSVRRRNQGRGRPPGGPVQVIRHERRKREADGLPFLLTIRPGCICGTVLRQGRDKKRAPRGRPARAGFWRAVPELLQGVYFLTGSTAFAASAE